MRTQQIPDTSILNELRSKIDRSIPMPIYYQLFMLIKDKIDSGQLNNGDMLPTEDNLSTALGISRPTIRQGLRELVSEGYLSRQKGIGTIVTRQKIEINYNTRHESFHEIIQKNGFTPSTRILDFKIIGPVPHVNEALQLPENEYLYYLKRLCMANGSPVLFTESYTQASRFPDLTKYDFSNASLYATLRDTYRDPVAGIRREVGATNAKNADAEMLDIPRGRAIFVVYNLGLDSNGRPMEYSVSRYRSEFMKFTNYMKC